MILDYWKSSSSYTATWCFLCSLRMCLRRILDVIHSSMTILSQTRDTLKIIFWNPSEKSLYQTKWDTTSCTINSSDSKKTLLGSNADRCNWLSCYRFRLIHNISNCTMPLYNWHFTSFSVRFTNNTDNSGANISFENQLSR